jgi:hypothetical protein
MATRIAKGAATTAIATDESLSLLSAGLDTLSFGFAIFDRELRVTASNKAFRTLRGKLLQDTLGRLAE